MTYAEIIDTLRGVVGVIGVSHPYTAPRLIRAIRALESFCGDQREFIFGLKAQIEKLEARLESQDTRPGLLQMEAFFRWLWDNNYVIAWEEDEGEEDTIGLTPKEYHELLDSFLKERDDRG